MTVFVWCSLVVFLWGCRREEEEVAGPRTAVFEEEICSESEPESCELTSVMIGDQTYEMQDMSSSADGFTKLYKGCRAMADGSLNWIVAKVVKCPKNLTREKSALTLLSRTGVVPQVLDAEIIGEKCQARTLVMPFLGDRNMFDLVDSPERRNVSELASFMVRALKIIKLVHSEGIVHGDVHMGNFVFWHSAGRVVHQDSLKLTGFGRAASYKDLRTGLHIAHSRKELLETNDLDNKNNISLLSRFDLQGWIPTRRDDLYRLSEIFIALLGFPESVSGRTTTVLDDKIFRDKNLQKLVLPIFANFHRYCTQLSFEADPNYDFWINQFKKLA